MPLMEVINFIFTFERTGLDYPQNVMKRSSVDIKFYGIVFSVKKWGKVFNFDYQIFYT